MKILAGWYRQLQDINRSLAEYNQQIEALAQTERYQKPVQALTCYKGIKTIFALTVITEIGDIQCDRTGFTILS